MAPAAAHGEIDGNLCRCGAYVSMREQLVGRVKAPAQTPVEAEDLEFVPARLEGAIRFRAGNPECLMVAGATDVTDSGDRPLLSLHRIAALRFLERSGPILHFGALATWTMLFEAMPEWDWIARVGSRQIRNIATLGGNIAGAKPAADLLPLLRLLGAEIETQAGLVVSVRLKLPEADERLYFQKVSRRRDLDIGQTIVAAVIGRAGEFRYEVGGRAPDHELARKLVEREAAAPHG
jgi:CO/xanthine dehydrogenase FAD-binding subunit